MELFPHERIVSCYERPQHFGEKNKFSHLHISINKGGTTRNSTDLDRGRRPELKSDEFLEVPLLFIEILAGGARWPRRTPARHARAITLYRANDPY